ncbi:MAG: glycoside hydrolase family 36 protein [Spirochaetota bacterium]
MNIKKGYIKYRLNEQNIETSFDIGKIYKDDNITVTFDIGKNRIAVNIKPKQEIIINKLWLEEEIIYDTSDKIFLNGYQSWTDSREFEIDEKIPKLSKLTFNKLTPYGDYGFYDYKEKKGMLHSWSYTYIKKTAEKFMFYGSLCENNVFTIFEHNTQDGKLHIISDCGGYKVKDNFKAIDVLYVEGKENYVFDTYFEKLGLTGISEKIGVKSSTGWTSWYNYYGDITEKIIISNLKTFANRNIPIDIFQVDDGYQSAIGDWLITNKKFLKGMKYIADKIKEKNYKAGLWLAPFICEKESKLYKEHPDWIAKDSKGKPILAGYNPGWSGDFYAINFYNEEFRNYIKKVFDTILNDWGYDTVKLDFLYAVALIQRDDKTRGQMMREAMLFLRELVGDKLILGCGVPLASAFGLADFCRIGPDIHLKWEQGVLSLAKHRERVSTLNAIMNTIGRRQLDGRAFYNDPDVFILRKENNKLTKEQRYSLFLLNQLFGSLIFTSDNISEYSDENYYTYLRMFPLKEKKIKEVEVNKELFKIKFEIENRNYTTLCNLGKEEVRLYLEEGLYFDNSNYEFIKGGAYFSLIPYSSICLLKVDESDKIQLLGGKAHIFAGCEVSKFKLGWLNSNIEIELDKNAMNNNYIYIKIPGKADGFKVNNNYIEAEKHKGVNIVKVKL